jgi:hypothetical protein
MWDPSSKEKDLHVKLKKHEPFSTLKTLNRKYLGDWTKYFGIYPYRKPTNASKWPLYCDV